MNKGFRCLFSWLLAILISGEEYHLGKWCLTVRIPNRLKQVSQNFPSWPINHSLTQSPQTFQCKGVLLLKAMCILQFIYFSWTILKWIHKEFFGGPVVSFPVVVGFPVVFHVQMWELDLKEGWATKNWCFQTVMPEKILESPLDCKDIKPVNPKGY